jgi:hypothetical protein
LHSSLSGVSAFHGLAHETLGSSHFSIARKILSGWSSSLSLGSDHRSKVDVNRRCGVNQRAA